MSVGVIAQSSGRGYLSPTVVIDLAPVKALASGGTLVVLIVLHGNSTPLKVLDGALRMEGMPTEEQGPNGGSCTMTVVAWKGQSCPDWVELALEQSNLSSDAQWLMYTMEGSALSRPVFRYEELGDEGQNPVTPLSDPRDGLGFGAFGGYSANTQYPVEGVVPLGAVQGAAGGSLKSWVWTESEQWRVGMPTTPVLSVSFTVSSFDPCDCADVLLICDPDPICEWDLAGAPEIGSRRTLVLNTVDENGTRWMLEDIDGWWTLPPPTLPDVSRPVHLDGSWPMSGRYGARKITLKGSFIPGPSSSGGRMSVMSPRARVLQALDSVRTGALLVVKEPVWWKQAWVWLSGQPRVEVKNSQGLTQFEAELTAVDPIKYHAGVNGVVRVIVPSANRSTDLGVDGVPAYGDGVLRGTASVTRSSWGSQPVQDASATIWGGAGPGFRRWRLDEPVTDPFAAELVTDAGTVLPDGEDRAHVGNVSPEVGAGYNYGNTTVLPRTFLYGPLSNPVITNTTTGQSMVFGSDSTPVSIKAGQTLVVDSYYRFVYLYNEVLDPTTFYPTSGKGTNVRWALSYTSPWLWVQPGRNVFTLNAVGSGRAVVSYRSGWVGS